MYECSRCGSLNRVKNGHDSKGALNAVIDRCYPLEPAAEAHRDVDTGHKSGCVIITATQHGKA
ncbi:MAG: zinc-binding dehydrogenase [Anaerolineae bacterium]|nr:zinc-binding dehydrogenase [Anaerolineae bacterium]